MVAEAPTSCADPSYGLCAFTASKYLQRFACAAERTPSRYFARFTALRPHPFTAIWQFAFKHLRENATSRLISSK